MRRNAADILFVYHYTHRPVVPFFPSSPLRFPLPSSSLSLSLAGSPALAPCLPPPSSLRATILLFSSPSSLSPVATSLSLSLSLPRLPPARHARPCIYFILLLNKPLSSCHPRADMRLYTRLRARAHAAHPRQTQSLHLTRGSAYATRALDMKNIFSPAAATPSPSSSPFSRSPCIIPLHVFRALSEHRAWALIATLKGIPS